VHREAPDLVAALVVGRHLAAADLAWSHHPLGRGPVVVEVADPDLDAGLGVAFFGGSAVLRGLRELRRRGIGS